MHAIELQVQQLSDAQPTGPLEQQGIGRETVRAGLEDFAQQPVGMRRQIAGQRPGQAGKVPVEDEPPGGASGQPHSRMSSSIVRTAKMRSRRSEMDSGAAVNELRASATADR